MKFKETIRINDDFLIDEENGGMRCHKKKYLPKDRTPYEIMFRVNKLK